jgi:hypothetical protein
MDGGEQSATTCLPLLHQPNRFLEILKNYRLSRVPSHVDCLFRRQWLIAGLAWAI